MPAKKKAAPKTDDWGPTRKNPATTARAEAVAALIDRYPGEFADLLMKARENHGLPAENTGR